MPIISFVYLLFFLITPSASSLLISHDEECLALFQFKQTILQEDYTTSSFSGGVQKLDSWRRPTISNMSDRGSSDCCLWDGVVCSKNEGHVIELDLSQRSIRGTIKSNSTLFNLVYLQKLNLSMNNFAESQIPSEIARLKQLTSLDLSDSGFSGEIPNEISHLNQLSLLDLSLNSLTLQNPRLLQNLTRLDKLNLTQVIISSSVPQFLANFSSLTSINFEDCQLQGNFPIEIFQLPKLKYLSLAFNPYLTGSLPEFRNDTLLVYLNLLKTGFVGKIPESISNLNHLVFFVLSGSFFSGSVPGSLSNLTQLTQLGLGFSYFTGIVPSFVRLSKLKILEFRYNDFVKGNDYYWIGKLANLEELYLDGMNIYQEILPSLANLTKLSVVHMATNYIFGRIPSSFMNLTQLIQVSLNDNQLHGTISSAFSNFKKLETLDLSGNKFEGTVDLDTFVGLNKLNGLYLEGISIVTTDNYTDETLPELEILRLSSCDLKEFPAFLRFRKKMTELDLPNNKIEGLIPAWIFDNSQETMYFVDLSNNKLIGEIPPSICQAKSLINLYLDSNSLTGTLPTCLGNFSKSLGYIDLSNNIFIGGIPPSIFQAQYLRYLILGSNSLTGTLSASLGNLSNTLMSLNLKQNKFHGTIPNTFTRKCFLKNIDLSENRFMGPLPKSLANCPLLEVLIVGDNSFVGVFPYWLGTLTELQVLILRSNRFSDSIQDQYTFRSDFPQLRILDLSNNAFSGQLPDNYFKTWKAMRSVNDISSSSVMGNMYVFGLSMVVTNFSMSIITKGVNTEYVKILNVFTAIDLSSNDFEGDIPQSLTDLRGLQSLNLSNNHLTGFVLPSLRNLKRLESLDLSHNELSGEIPRELIQLGFLAMFNVSFNHLEGGIPTGGQFDTFDNYSYVGNLELCGQPLSKDCQGSTTSTLPQTIDEYESLFPDDIIDWVVIFAGFVSGLVIGFLLWKFLYARYYSWFIDRFGMRNDTWVRPLRNKKRN
ncbi:receptor-like protein 7 [Rutidosis leptorrhynchoides]|uniref:receptor-like protein 7 n=1 Tax=Rutidosis leptorrhynchoides TaxID=125765 RepID=UPI003A9983A6